MSVPASSLGVAGSRNGKPRLAVASTDAAPAGITYDKGRLVLPPIPAVGDIAGCCSWLTTVFNLNRAHPITGGAHEGLRGPDGHVVLHRLDAPALRFEPAARINTPLRLFEALNWRMLPSDGAIYDLKGGHCKQIAQVVRMLCGATAQDTDEQETAGLVGAFLQGAELVEGHTTYGTSGERYEAATALRPVADEPRYLLDRDTGELVVRLVDLASTARKYVGGTVPRGWLEARMEGMGWSRVRLDGHALPGRAGRNGPHVRCDVYRGHLPVLEDPAEGSVTT